MKAPTDDIYRLELVYDRPAVFKTLFGFFKGMHTTDVLIRFTPQDVTFFAYDQTQKNRIVACLPGAQLNRYYCESTVWMQMNRERVEKIFNQIDATMYKISLRQRSTAIGDLHIVLKEYVLDAECNYQINVETVKHNETLLDAERFAAAAVYNSYPISMSMPWRSFKQTISRIANLHKGEVSVEKMGRNPLQFTYGEINGPTYNEVYYNTEKINLRSTVGDQQAFRCRFLVPTVQALAAASIADTLHIHFDSTQDIIFRANLGAMQLVTVTKTVNG